jgi:hypothetical protein
MLRRELRRTHRQLAAGQYAQAYPTLKRLAERAARGGMPVQAGTLYAQAALARVQMAAPGAQNAAWDAVELGQQMLELLSAAQSARAQRLLAQVLQLLERKNYHEQAVELRAAGTALLGAKVDRPPPPQATLPERCPACTAPLRADEVEWTSGQRAACAYCGAAVLD